MDDREKAVGRAFQRAREDAKYEQEEVAQLVDRTRTTISRWENGYPIPDDMGVKLVDIYVARGASIPPELRRFLNVPRGTSAVREAGASYQVGDDVWSPNPALATKIPSRAYDVAIAYCRRLQAADWPREEIEQIERLMIDARYAQANKRKGRDLSVDDQIMLIDATWEAVKATAAALGRQV